MVLDQFLTILEQEFPTVIDHPPPYHFYQLQDHAKYLENKSSFNQITINEFYYQHIIKL